MEDKTRPSNTPSNYVTLLQLQDRWIKEQQRKLKEKEEQQHSIQNLELKIEEKHPNPQAHANRRNSKRHNRHRNRNLTETGVGVCPEENHVTAVSPVVEASESESTVKETKSSDSGSKKKKWNRKEKKKTIQDGEGRAQGEYPEPRAPHFRSEQNSLVTRHERRSDTRLDYRPKITSVVKKRNQILKTAEEVENAAKENLGTPKIERKLEDLSIKNESNSSGTQTRVVDCINRKDRGCTSIDNRTVNRKYFGYKGYDGGLNRPNGHHGGSYGSFNHYAEQKGKRRVMVWVKRKEVADAGESAGDQSSTNSVKQ